MGAYIALLTELGLFTTCNWHIKNTCDRLGNGSGFTKHCSEDIVNLPAASW